MYMLYLVIYIQSVKQNHIENPPQNSVLKTQSFDDIKRLVKIFALMALIKQIILNSKAYQN